MAPRKAHKRTSRRSIGDSDFFYMPAVDDLVRVPWGAVSSEQLTLTSEGETFCAECGSIVPADVETCPFCSGMA